jgi:hypothetical protein
MGITHKQVSEEEKFTHGKFRSFIKWRFRDKKKRGTSRVYFIYTYFDFDYLLNRYNFPVYTKVLKDLPPFLHTIQRSSYFLKLLSLRRTLYRLHHSVLGSYSWFSANISPSCIGLAILVPDILEYELPGTVENIPEPGATSTPSNQHLRSLIAFLFCSRCN